jgi:TorA maturation chaperone TorD
MKTASLATEFDPAVSLARQYLYRFAALSLLDPRSGAWTHLQRLREDVILHDAAGFLRSLPEACTTTLALGERSVDNLSPRLVLDRLPQSFVELNAEYERTFGLLVSGACPTYESEYIDSKFAFQRSNALADLNGFYHAFGLKVSEKYPERPDHIVLELEFMARLLALESAAWDAEPVPNFDAAAVCRDAQVRFLSEHLAWWAPAFARLLGRENPQGYYAAVGVFLAALIPAERALLGVPPESRIVRPSVAETQELCDGCQIAG